MITGHIDLQTIFARNLGKAGSTQKYSKREAKRPEVQAQPSQRTRCAVSASALRRPSAVSVSALSPQSAHEHENNDENDVSQIFWTNSQYFSVRPQIFLLPRDKRQDAPI